MRPKEIKKLIELVEASSISELEVTRFGRKVRISKNSSTTTVTTSPATLAPPPAAVPETPSTETQKESQAAKPAPEPQALAENIYEVKSPMVGTFYRAPAPDADPYVEIGDIVAPNQVLCIIEAMKLMNEIECEVRGKVVEILAENGKPVEYDQVLFRIEKI